MYKSKHVCANTTIYAQCCLSPAFYYFQHLDISGNYAKLLFIDLSSTFNSIRHHQVIKKLQRSPIILIYWIHNFLSNRPQVVKMGSALSPTIVLNTGRR